MTTVPPITKELVVKTTQEHAFRVFTAGINRWWPRQHHIGTAPLKELIIEPRTGGRWYAISEDDSQCDTGKVLAWEPPSRLVLTWQITGEWKFDPSFVTEIEVNFTALSARSTRVTFEHRNLERYGAAAEEMRRRMGAPEGWGVTFDAFAQVAAQKAVVFYESAPDVLEKAPLHFPAHKKRLDAFHARGELLAVGLFGDPREGSMAVFQTREAAEEFVREDPFVVNGVVARATIKDWSESLL
jgi:uncharacterized protein YciI/uncharacterized protein YndB with AHSA1/START domain